MKESAQTQNQMLSPRPPILASRCGVRPTLGISGGARRRPLHAVVSPRPSLGRGEVCGYHVLVPELISVFNAPRHPVRRTKEAPYACRHKGCLANVLRPVRCDLLGCQLRFSPSRQAMASSSTRTASSTEMTGRAWNSKAGYVEQNL